MGCDGGSIPRREELVKLKKKAEKVDPTEVERIKWFTCAMSHERLKEPIVVCELGRLYNKEAVIRALIDKNIAEKFSHIRSLKDLITPRFTPNPAYNASSADTDTSASRAPFLCPITLIEVGHSPFDIIRTCGCVLSDRAMREVPSTTCLQCGASFTTEDVIHLNPESEEKEVLRARMEARREGEKSKKKEKREKRREKKEKENGEVKNETSENGHSKENGEKGEKKERSEKENGEKANGTKEKNLGLDKDKKGKKRDIESSASTSEHSAKASKLNHTSSSSSSKRTTTTTTTTTTTAIYTASVTPHGGEKDEKDKPAHLTVQKTAAYNSLFRDEVRKTSNANRLFSGIY
jgi:hypothetical protein